MTIRMKEKNPEKEFIVVEISFNKTRFLVSALLKSHFSLLKEMLLCYECSPKAHTP